MFNWAENEVDEAKNIALFMLVKHLFDLIIGKEADYLNCIVSAVLVGSIGDAEEVMGGVGGGEAGGGVSGGSIFTS